MGLILKEGVDDAGRVALDLDGKQHSDIAERRADESKADDIAVDEDESVDFDANNRMESFECEQDEKSSVGSVGSHKERYSPREDYDIDRGREQYDDTSSHNLGEKYNSKCPQDVWYKKGHRSTFPHSDLDMTSSSTKKSPSENRRDNDLYRRSNTEFSGREQYNLSHCLDLETTSNSRKCTFDNVGDNHRENGSYQRAYSGLYGREHFSADAQRENNNRNRPQDICYTNDLSNFSHTDVSRRTDSNGIIKASTIVRQSMGDRYHNIHKMDAFAEEIEVLRPLPLRSYTSTKEAYVNWTNEEIEYARKAYDIVNPTLPPDQKRFIARELLKHIRNDPEA
jgi:hypothetical protein